MTQLTGEWKKRMDTAAQVISQQLADLEALVDSARRPGDYTTGLQRFRRWESRTRRVLAESVHPREAGNLDTLSPLVIYADSQDEFLNESRLHIAFLDSLLEEVVTHPEDALEVQTKTDPQPNAAPRSARPVEARRPAPSSGGMTVNIHGGNVNIGQTVSGDVHQSMSAPSEVAEIHRLLRDVEKALEEIEAPPEERDAFITQVHQIRGEIAQTKPILGRLVNGWGAVSTWATLEGAWQGWDRVQSIAVELAPRLHAFIQLLTSGAGS